MPLKTYINGTYIRRNGVLMPLHPEVYQKTKDLLNQRLSDLEREAERIANDKKRVEEYLRTLPNP